MKVFRADLHCHSTCSDGTYTPAELVKHAVHIGLSGLSITDHDNMDAYETALPLAKELGLEMIIGAEFSSTHADQNVHVLAYSFQLDHPAIVNLCRRHQERRSERNRQILEKLRKLGMPIDEPIQEHSIGRPHIAKAMVQKGYVKSIDEAFHRFLGDGKCCYAPGQPVSTEETISIIHEAHGLAVIAHPHLLKRSDTIDFLVKLPFDGIECYYAKLGQERRWLELAKNKGWLVTGGSDFHGSVKPDITLGSSWVGEETFRRLQHGA